MMQKPQVHLSSLIAVVCWVACGSRIVPAAEKQLTDHRPNILIVLCDDLGYGDLGCFGHPEVQTPNIDRFAAESMKLNHCYSAAPNCSPARTGLMTGRTPYRVGIHNWIPFMSPMHVRESEITVATLLRDAGYATCLSGKWHLNGNFNLPGQPQPDDHGFQHWFATQNNALPNHRNPYNFVRNGIPVGPQQGYAAQLVSQEAMTFLDQHNPQQPFFLFVSFHEPHEPIATAPKFSSLYDSDVESLKAHHGNISQMDDAFGLLMRKLQDEGFAEDTLVFFTSDNGPARTSIHPHGSTGGLREKKGHLFEGGIRVPGIIRWPGRIQAGTESDIPVTALDVLPTCCELANVPVPRDRTLDGVSLVSMFSGKPPKRTRPLYWQFHYAQTTPDVAIRSGRWKLLAELDLPHFGPGADLTEEMMTALKAAEVSAWELYDIAVDPAETHDVSDEYPEVLQRLQQQLRSMHQEVTQESPVWPSWKWPRYESERIEWPPYRGKRRTPAPVNANR